MFILKYFHLVLLAALLGCEGPAGPQGEAGPAGPSGPMGPQGETGPARQSVVIEELITSRDYNSDGVIEIEDERISPDTFVGIFVRLRGDEGYFALEYVLISSVSIWDEDEEFGTPLVYVEEGLLRIRDDNEILLDFGDDIYVAVVLMV